MEMEKIINLSKQYGFIFQGSEIYGGLANTWDYGPLGVEVKNNIKKLWWQRFVQENKHNVGMDASILMNPTVWKASGHIDGFSDPLIDCKKCKTRHRADKIVEDFLEGEIDEALFDDKKLLQFINENKVVCPKCGALDYTNIRKFNLMFKTSQGVTEDSTNEIYLRPETAQGIFTNFVNVQRSMRLKLPFGIAQIGKAFRNEITPGNFTFRTREFEQMELEFFCKPGTEIEWFNYYKDYSMKFLKDLNLQEENLKFRDHEEDELSHYSNATVDIEYKFPFGFGELWGIASRTDYDLSKHIEYSKKDLTYFDPETNERYIPYVIEPSLGADRLTLAILCDAYYKEELENGEERVVMKFHPAIAPYKAAVLPLVKKYHTEKANEVYEKLSKKFMVSYDESGNIGKRYRRQDIIGTPFAITIDDETLNNSTVTVRFRDDMSQVTINLDELESYIENKIKF